MRLSLVTQPCPDGLLVQADPSAWEPLVFHLMHNRFPKLAIALGVDSHLCPLGPLGLNLGSLGSLEVEAGRLLNLFVGVGVCLDGVELLLSLFCGVLNDVCFPLYLVITGLANVLMSSNDMNASCLL